MAEVRLPFRPRARLLQLLGDQLIGSHRLAVHELVKNAFDADASKVTVTLNLPTDGASSIEVCDDGDGMSLATLRDVWLVPGDDHREIQRKAGRRTARFNRLPLGEKGLGRFAAHKLGDQIELVTRAASHPEYLVSIDWPTLTDTRYLADAPVTIVDRRPKIFAGKATGTSITIRRLRHLSWGRGEVRRLYRDIVSMCSPFDGTGEFAAILSVPSNPEWIDDIPDVDAILRSAFWEFRFSFDDGRFDWDYSFRPRGVNIAGRKVRKSDDRLLLAPHGRRKSVVADASSTIGIGKVAGRFYLFDRDRDVLALSGNSQLISGFLDDQGGVRVYRDGIRVYNYGEPTDDWLGLDLRRVNRPTKGISRNLVLGAVSLSLDGSFDLVEKTNREGFVENDAQDRLKHLVLGALSTFEAERRVDKDRLRRALGKNEILPTVSFSSAIESLRRETARAGLNERLGPLIDKIENDYSDLQENLLRPTATGLTLALVFHEVERGVRAIHRGISGRESTDQLERQARDLMHMLDGFAVLLRRDEKKTHTIGELIRQSLRFNRLRLQHHRIDLALSNKTGDEMRASFSMNLALGALSNLIDNSIYWMKVRWPEGKSGRGRRLYVSATDELSTGLAVVVADTGTGFRDPPESLVQPFFTRKPDGMGLGLYYANLVMELHGGTLTFPSAGDVGLPSGFDGALVALEFQEAK